MSAPEKKFWIIWNPAWAQPPRTRFATEKEALAVAEKCARQWKAKLYVMRSTALVGVEEAPVTTTRLK